MRCNACGKTVDDTAKFCKYCGSSDFTKTPPPAEPKNFCPHCGAALKADAKFCGSCGESLGVRPTAPRTPAHIQTPEKSGSKKGLIITLIAVGAVIMTALTVLLLGRIFGTPATNAQQPYDMQSPTIDYQEGDSEFPVYDEPAEAPIVHTPEETIEALNALFGGMSCYPGNYGDGVSVWSDEALCSALYGKLMWSSNYFVESVIDYSLSDDGYWHYKLEDIQRLSLDTFDQSFPESGMPYLFISGDEVLLAPSAGESVTMLVQDFSRDGDIITAVGIRVANYSAYSEFESYFQAILRENPGSTYGYTLLGLFETEGDQSFDNMSVSASSELHEPGIVHYAARAYDGDLGTAWVEGVDGVGVGQSIELTTNDGAPISLYAIGFHMGYQKSEQLLINNGWPYRIAIECDDYYGEFELYDYTDVVILDRPLETSSVEIRIVQATRGEKYDDTCITEIELYGIGQ